MSDIDLADTIKNTGDSDALLELESRHTGLYVKISQNYTLNQQALADLLEEKRGNIYDAVVNYDKDRGMSFPTYLAESLKWKCLSKHSQDKKMPSESIDGFGFDFIDSKQSGPDQKTETADTIRRLYSFMDEYPDKRVKEIFDIRFFGDDRKNAPWYKVGKRIGMSHEMSRKIWMSFIEAFKKELDYA